jgi:hypothetical protein
VVDLLARVPGPIPGPMLFQIAAVAFIAGFTVTTLRREQVIYGGCDTPRSRLSGPVFRQTTYPRGKMYCTNLVVWS